MPITFPDDQFEVMSYHFIEDDFIYQASATASDANTWTAVNDGATGTPAYQSASGSAGGWFNTVTAAADNDYAAYRTVSKVHKIAAGKKLWFAARYKLAEATTQESAYWFGFTDTVTTGGFGTDTNGPLASYDGILFYKTPETAMTVNFQASNAAVKNTISAFGTAITNTTHEVQMYYDGVGYVTCHFYNGSIWVATPAVPIPTSVSTMDEMYLVWGVKAGPTAAAETLQLDYIKAVQTR